MDGESQNSLFIASPSSCSETDPEQKFPLPKNHGFADRPSPERGLNPIPEDLWWLRAEFQANTNTFPSADVVDPSPRMEPERTRRDFTSQTLRKVGKNQRGNCGFPSSCRGHGAPGENGFVAIFGIYLKFYLGMGLSRGGSCGGRTFSKGWRCWSSVAWLWWPFQEPTCVPGMIPSGEAEGVSKG